MNDLHPGDEGDENGDELPRDVAYDLLSHRRRRYAVAYLREAAAPLAVADLARRIVQWEREEGAGDDEGTDPVTVRHALHHRHLPRLADAGVVERDRDRGTVEPGPRFDDLWAWLSDEESDDGCDARTESA